MATANLLPAPVPCKLHPRDIPVRLPAARGLSPWLRAAIFDKRILISHIPQVAGFIYKPRNSGLDTSVTRGLDAQVSPAVHVDNFSCARLFCMRAKSGFGAATPGTLHRLPLREAGEQPQDHAARFARALHDRVGE